MKFRYLLILGILIITAVFIINSAVAYEATANVSITNSLGVKIYLGILDFIFPESAIALSITDLNPSNIVTYNSSQLLSFNLTAEALANITYVFNNTRYSLYDDSLVLFYNFDNRSSLGENDTFVRDLSRYGNNGSVIGGSNVSWTPNGRYNGAFNFSGNVNGIDSIDNVTIGSYNFTLSAWIYASDNTTETGVLYIYNTTNIYYGFGVNSGQINIYARNTTVNNNNLRGAINKNVWYKIDAVFINDTYRIVYINGIKVGTDVTSSTGFMGSGRIVIGHRTPTASFFNGTIDSVYVWNRSLTASEILNLYNVQLTKYNSKNWSAYINQTGINAYSQSYQICSNNFTGTELCSNSESIRRLDLVNANSLSLIKILNNNSYGVNVGIKRWFGASKTIDIDGDGTFEGNSNLTWHQQMFSNSKMNYIRMDMDLGTYYSNSSDGSINMTGNLTSQIGLVNFASQNNYKVMLTGGKMPLFLANRTVLCYSDNSTCPPLNYTYYTLMLTDFINRTTSNGSLINYVELEAWNEPDSPSNFLKNATITNINRSVEFNKVYNATWQVKNYFPTLKIGGAGTSHNLNFDKLIMNNWIGNFSTQFDFITYHLYQDVNEINIYDLLNNDIDNIVGNCTSYSASCNQLVISEYNIVNQTEKNLTSYQNVYSKDIALALIGALKNTKFNVSMIFYQWSERYKYSNSANYPEYPQLWSMVSEPQLDNAIYPPYSVTSNFTRYAPAGSNIYSPLVYSDCIKAVHSVLGTTASGVLINTCNYDVNVSVYGAAGTLISVNTGTLYTFDGSNPVNLGVMDAYDVEYYTTPIVVTTTTQNGVVTNYYNYLGELLLTTESAAFTNTNAFCTSVINGPQQFFSQIGLILLVVAVVVVIGVLIVVVKVAQDPTYDPFDNINIDWDRVPVHLIFGSILAIGLFIYLLLMIMGALCP